jgi:serine/threonine protein phosphatase PrpC
MTLNITYATEQNRRFDQEDRFLISKIKLIDAHLIGVFDGHGGSWVSEFAAKHTPYIFRALTKKFPYDTMESLMEKTVARLNEKTKFYHSGSTCALMLISANKVFVAILGDSNIIIGFKNNTHWISPVHNIRINHTEADRACENEDAIIYHGYLCDAGRPWAGGLQMSRSLGDCDLSRVLTRTPDIYSFDIEHIDWVLCCTDGVIDQSNLNLVALKEIYDSLNNKKTIASDILDIVNIHDTNDNATAILVSFI